MNASLRFCTLWMALLETDLIVAPPGHSKEDVSKLIKAMHLPNKRTT